jgi:phospholipid/cholesterol/gamma-HCH transport system substrate-binding protein
MRSRTLREGSLGLFIILGLSLFAVAGLWLKGFQAGRKSYRFVAEFDHVAGIQAGATVRYRGVTVGRVTLIAPGPNGVDMEIEITSSDLLLPSGVTIEVNQGGFIGETAVDLLASTDSISDPGQIARPLDNECDSSIIICDGDRRRGQLGVSFDQLTRSSLQFTRAFSDPVFVNELQVLLQNTSGATAEITTLAKEISTLTELFQGEVQPLSSAALATTASVDRAVNNIDGTVDRVNRLMDTVNQLLEDNRGNVVSTLDRVSQLSDELSLSAAALRPVILQADTALSTVNATLTEFDQTTAISNIDALVTNAVTLSENAAIASVHLRDLSASLNDPDTLLQLQLTLDSARTTFENVEKITSDLDDLTGDPDFRENLRRTVNGLSGLVSATQQLDQYAQILRTVPPSSDGYATHDRSLTETTLESPPANLPPQP